jgi:hypothetical protein
MLEVVRLQQSVETLLVEQVPQKSLAGDRKGKQVPQKTLQQSLLQKTIVTKKLLMETRSKGTLTLCNLKEVGILWDSEDKRAMRTFSILFSKENPSGTPSGNWPIVMVDRYKGSSMCDSNAPVQECTMKSPFGHPS